MDPLYLQDPIKPAATQQAAKGLRDAINNDSPMMSGFVSGTYGYGGSSLLGLANLAEVAGADSVGKGLRKKATALFDTAQKFTPSAMSLDSVQDFGSGVDYVRANAGQGLGSMLPVIAGGAAGLAPGLAAATAPMYGENIGRLEQDPTLSGMSAGQKALHAAPTAAVQGALNYVVPGGFAAAAGRQIAAKTGTGALGKAGVTLGTVGLVEGATEGGEELARQGMHTLANPERDTGGDNKQLLESFVGGMVGGSPIGAVQAGAGYVQDRMAEREQDTRTLAQKAGDAVADVGGALGRRQGERDAAPANAALDAIEQEAQARGVPPRDVIAERIQRLNTPVDLSDAFTEAEATQRVMQDEEGKRATADELVQSILNDPDAAPEMRRTAEEHVAAVQAGATNKYEETGMKLGEAERKRAGVMGLVDTIAKAIEPVAGKPAPAKRGSAMTPNAPRYSDEELYRHAMLYETVPDLRTLSINELSQLDRTIDRFAKGEFGPEVRKTLDGLFGSPEATETVLDFYKPGASTVNTQQYDPDGGRTGADRTVAQEDESFSEATERDEANPLPTETKVEWGTGSFKLGENSYFDTKDAAQKERLAKTQSVLGRDKPGASPKTAAIGMVDAEIERRGVEDAEAQRAVKLEITNQFFPQMDLMSERPANYDKLDRFARTDHDRRFQAFEKELNKRVRATNLRFQTVKATSEASKGGGLDYNDEDIKSLSLNMGKTGLNNPKTAHTRGVLIFERSDAQTPMITSAPMLLRRAFQIGADREQTGDEVGKMQNLSDLLDMSIASVLDYSARKTAAQQDYAERGIRGEVAVDEMMPEAPKMQFTGRIGYVKYGKPVYVDRLRDLPDDFRLMEQGGRTYTMGDLKAALGRKNADVAREATKTRNKLERMIKSGALTDLPKDVRARIAQAVSAHKKNPNNSVAAGAVNALYAKHVGGVYKDAPTDFERDDIVPSESETFTDENGQPLERGLLQYGPVGESAPIQRDADGFTSSNPAYNMTGRAQSPESRRIKEDKRVVDAGVVTEDVAVPRMRELRDSKDLPVGMLPVVDDFGNIAMETETRFVGRMTRPARPGEMNRQADTVLSRGEDNMSPVTKPLPENARALYKTESPAEWVVGVLAPRNGVEAAGKAWRTVKNATTDKMKKSRNLMARALHQISEMETNDFRLTFNKELTAQQAQTMINRAKSVIDQEKVPDDRPGVVGESAAANGSLGKGRQADNGSPGQARGADARAESRAASNTGQVAQALQRSDTGAVAQGASAAKFTELTKSQIAKFVKQLDADDDRVSDAAEKALNKLEADFLAKAKEAGQIKDDESRLRSTKGLFDAAQELDMEYDEFNKGYDQLERSAAVAGNAFEKLRNDIARFASKDFVEALDQDIEDTIDRLEDINDDLGGDLERGINLFETLRSIKAEQEAQQGKLFNKQGANAQDADTPRLSTTADGLIKAVTFKDKGIVAYNKNVTLTAREKHALALHEIGVHYGLERMVGKERFQEILAQLRSMRGKSKNVDTAYASVPKDTKESLVDEEALAYLVENYENMPFVKRLIEAVRNWFNQTFKGVKTFEKDMHALANAALAEYSGKVRTLNVESIQKTPKEGFVKVDFQKALTSSPEMHKLLDQIVDALGGKVELTGSLAMSSQLNVYRAADEQIHDLDFRYTGTHTELIADLKANLSAAQLIRAFFAKRDKRFLVTIAAPAEGVKIAEVVQTNRRSKEVVLGSVGSEQVRILSAKEINVVDFFIGSERGEPAVQQQYVGIDGKTRRVLLTSAKSTFDAKFDMGREKDIRDALLADVGSPAMSETQRSEQNAQTPGEATTDAKRTAELKAALTEVKRLLGKDFDAQVSNELFDPVSGAAWSGEFDPQQMRILIAAGATDTMGTGRHEALHALFKMLRDMGHPEAVKVIENLANNKLVIDKLKILLADHKNALEQLKDPEEAAAYAFQFWMADRLKLGPQAKTFFQKVMNFLNKAQLALRDKVFGSEVAKDERARLKQDALALKLLGAFRDGAMASPEGRVSVQTVLEANKQALEARRLNTRAFGHKLHNFLKQGVYSAASVFEDSANPHVKALGKMFFRMEGDVRGEKQSFLEAAAQANDRYQVKVRNILVKLDKDTAELVSKYMNNRTELEDIHHPEAHEAVKALRNLLDDLLFYQRSMNTARWDAELMEWVPMGEVEKNYYPRVWSINVLTEKQGEFIEKMTKALEKYRRDFKGFPEIEEFRADTMAKAILNKLINGAGSNDIEEMTSDLGITPWQASVNKRDLNWLDDVAPGEFTEYFSNDVAEVMTSYISQATKRAEYNHAFGRGGEKLREGMYNAIVHEMGGVELAEKAAARLKVMNARRKKEAVGERGDKPNLVAAAREVLLEDHLEALNPDMEWTNEMIAQVRLGEHGFLKDSSINVEDVAKVREGVDKIHADAVAKLEPVTKAIMAMEGTLGREIDPTLRHVMSGVTTFQNFRLLPLALFASINDVVGMVARGGTMKDSFQAFTRGIKEVGLMWKGEYSQDELAKLAERLGTVGGGNYLDAMGQTYSSQFMYGKLRRWNDALFKWNGLEAWNRAARIQATGVAIEFIKRHVEKPNEHSKRYLEELFGKDYDTGLIMRDGDLDYSNDRVREAVLTWVNGAVLRPNASHRPIYASDPHYMLFYHLKQFAYSFHKVILRRAWIEAKAGNYTPAAALFTGYVPVSIAADVVKETLIMGDDDPWWTKGGLTAYLEHGVARANLGGVPQMWLGDIADPVMAFKDPGRYVGSLSNVAGPAPDQLLDLISVPFLEDKTLVKEAAGGVPGGVLIRRYVN